MKRIVILLALAAATAALVLPAEAGIFRKAKAKPTAPRTEIQQTWRYDRLPTMAFTAGELRQEGYGWKVGNLALTLGPKCEIIGPSGPTNLGTGQQVVVMGPRLGGTIVAWRIDVQRPETSPPPRSNDTQITWSDSDPTVGVGHAPN